VLEGDLRKLLLQVAPPVVGLNTITVSSEIRDLGLTFVSLLSLHYKFDKAKAEFSGR